MSKNILIFLFAVITATTYAQSSKAEWIETSETEQWKTQNVLPLVNTSGKADVEIEVRKPLQTIEGFGTCFNELG